MKGKEKSLSGERKIPIELIIGAILVVATAALPWAKYKYNGTYYNVPGYYFLTGNTISGGSCTFGPHGVMWLIVILQVVMIIGSVMYPRLKVRVGGYLISLASMASIVATIFLSTRFSRFLNDAKSVSINFGTAVAIILEVLIIVRCMWMMKKEEVLSALDFMLFPGMIYLIINNYIPMIGIFIAFKDVDYTVGIFKSEWAGMENFKMLFAHTGSIFSSDAFIITRNTLLYNAVFIVLGMVLGIIIGICLADIANKFLQRFFQTAVLLPQLISMVIVAYIVYGFLSNETGFLNNTIFADNPIDFYQTRKFWPFILVIVYMWKQAGYNSIIFLSSIVGIDASLYEAAKVDGATKWHQIRKITLPLLKPTVITLFLMQTGRIFYSDFGLFYQVPMDSGTLYAVTNTVDTYVYRSLMVLNNISTSSAASTYQAVVGFALVLLVNGIIRKVDRESAMF